MGPTDEANRESGGGRLRSSPLVVAAVAALIAGALGIIGNTVAIIWNGKIQQQQAENQLITDAVKTNGDRYLALRNLQFLIESGRVDDSDGRIAKMAKKYAPMLPVQQGSGVTNLNSRFAAILLTRTGDLIRGYTWDYGDGFTEADGATARNLGALACQSNGSCVVVDDRNRYASLFEISSYGVIRPLFKKVPLMVLARTESKLDIEAVSYENGNYLFVGSHSVSVKRGSVKENRRHLFLVPAKDFQGRIATSGEDEPPDRTKKASLHYIFSNHPDFKEEYNGLLLQRGGVNVEGAALDGESVLIGMRAPSPLFALTILRLNRDDLFAGEEPEPEIFNVAVDRKGIGIRDMAKLDDGFLLLTGDSHSEASAYIDPQNPDLDKPTIVGNPFELYFWDGSSQRARLVGTILGAFPSIEDFVKAEGLLVLPDNKPDAPTLDVLITFDGIENGAPTSFQIPRDLVKAG